MKVGTVLVDLDIDHALSLEKLTQRVPVGVPLNVVMVEYAGCGTHAVRLTWPKGLEPVDY